MGYTVDLKGNYLMSIMYPCFIAKIDYCNVFCMGPSLKTTPELQLANVHVLIQYVKDNIPM